MLHSFFNKWAIPCLFLFIFGLFQTNINTILQQIHVKKCPSSIRHRESNPRPSERESPPITTRPGLHSLELNRATAYLAIDASLVSVKQE